MTTDNVDTRFTAVFLFFVFQILSHFLMLFLEAGTKLFDCALNFELTEADFWRLCWAANKYSKITGLFSKI